MRRFAESTTVPVERSRAEIESLVMRHGATEFQSGWRSDAAMIGFRLNQLYVRFVLPFPDRKEQRFTHKRRRNSSYQTKLSDNQSAKLYDQELRSRWRALHLVIKAKLEAVEVGISTIEQEFLSWVVLPNNQTMGEWIMDQAIPQVIAGRMPMLALPAPPDPKIVDAEVVS